MRLLIITQTVDQKDPVLGFFHRWIEEFSKHAESIVVIGNSSGVYSLPKNVEVFSLGKYPGLTGLNPSREPFERIVRSIRFLFLIISLRRRYDTVLVHMTPEHLVLGGLFFKLFGKRAFLWYNHTTESPWLSFAAGFAKNVFHTSPYAASARFKNAKRMPAGIDTELFKPQTGVQKIPGSVYFQGRVAASKNVRTIVEAFVIVHKKGIGKHLTIVGPEDKTYVESLKKDYAELIKNGTISFLGPRPHDTTPELYASHEVSVNLTDRGNYDKTVLESLACGTPCIVSSDAFEDIIQSQYRISSAHAETLAHTLEHALSDTIDPNELRLRVTMKHSLPLLAKELTGVLSMNSATP